MIADWRAVDVWVSPLGRTRETAEIALRDVPAEPKIVPELAEISVGGWEGLRRGEIEKLEPRFANPSQSERFEVYCNSPGGKLCRVQHPNPVGFRGFAAANGDCSTWNCRPRAARALAGA